MTTTTFLTIMGADSIFAVLVIYFLRRTMETKRWFAFLVSGANALLLLLAS